MIRVEIAIGIWNRSITCTTLIMIFAANAAGQCCSSGANVRPHFRSVSVSEQEDSGESHGTSGAASQYPSEVTIGTSPNTRSSQQQVGVTPQGTPQSAFSSRDLFGKGSFFFLRRDYRNAAIFYQQALDLEKHKRQLPTNQWRVLVDNLAMAYGILGNLNQAQETVQYGLSRDPKYPSFYYTLACIYGEKNDINNALSNLKIAFQYRHNMIPGEHMPNPRTDDSFRRFKNDNRFRKLVASLPVD